MRCSNCGMELNGSTKFCNNCGANLDGVVANYNVVGKTNNILFYVLLVTVVLGAISCFLPYVSVLDLESNYVYFDPGFGSVDVKDGILVVIFSVLSVIFLLLKKRIPILVFQSLSLIVFILDYFNDTGNNGNLIEYKVGFYLVLIALIASFVLSLLRVILKKKFK